MGLFDFASDNGERIFGSTDDAADKIRTHIEANNPGIENVGVSFEHGVATLSGDPTSQIAIEKAVLIAGNVRGVEEVKVDMTRPLELDDRIEFYTIQAGDTLLALADRYYGNAMEYSRIFEANREVIRNPDEIYVGQKIRIPLDLKSRWSPSLVDNKGVHR